MPETWFLFKSSKAKGMSEVWMCHLCGVAVRSDPARSNHMRNFWKTMDDPSRCDNLQAADAAVVTQVPLITMPNQCGTGQPHNIIDSRTTLSRKLPTSWTTEREMRGSYCIVEYNEEDHGPPASVPRDMTPLQDRWESFLIDLSHKCHINFWSLFLSMHELSGKAIDSALRAVKKCFVQPKDRKKFPISRRALFSIIKEMDPFWPHVLHTCRVDLSRFNLPSGTKVVKFKFIDPIWGWLVAARRQHPREIHWKPVHQRNGAEVYGGGIQYGQFFAHACKTVPRGALPMCIGLHWDGTGAHGLSSSPICVCVGNTNSSKSDTQYCIGYFPHVPDEKKPEWKKHPTSTKVKFYIRQRCAAAILRVMEESAARGVKCRLPNSRNEDVTLLLYPRLSSMNFDQPEAQLFFGLQNKHSCSKCRFIILFNHC